MGIDNEGHQGHCTKVSRTLRWSMFQATEDNAQDSIYEIGTNNEGYCPKVSRTVEAMNIPDSVRH